MPRLTGAPETLYLTGSRYFGGATEQSDWDYFAQDTPEMQVWLHDAGFKYLGRCSGWRSMPTRTYRNDPRGIEVALVENVMHKRLARDLIRVTGMHRHLDEDIKRQKVWDAVEQQVKCWFWFLKNQ